MKKVSSFLKTWYGALITCGVLIATQQIAFTITKKDLSNKVDIERDWKQDGYEKIPGHAEITASYSKVWHDAKASDLHHTLKTLSFIVCFLPLVWAWRFDGTDSKNNAIWISLGFIAVAALVLPYIVPLRLKSSAEYTKKICLKNYVEGKNYDYLFPETDEQKPGSLDAFYKSCK